MVLAARHHLRHAARRKLTFLKLRLPSARVSKRRQLFTWRYKLGPIKLVSWSSGFTLRSKASGSRYRNAPSTNLLGIFAANFPKYMGLLVIRSYWSNMLPKPEAPSGRNHQAKTPSSGDWAAVQKLKWSHQNPNTTLFTTYPFLW